MRTSSSATTQPILTDTEPFSSDCGDKHIMLRFILSVSALVALAMAEDGAIEVGLLKPHLLTPPQPHFTLELLGDMVKRHLTGNVQLKNAPSRQSDFLIRHSHDKPQAEHLGAPTFQALNGLYVTPCEDLSDQVIGGPYPLSAFSIREFGKPVPFLPLR